MFKANIADCFEFIKSDLKNKLENDRFDEKKYLFFLKSKLEELNVKMDFEWNFITIYKVYDELLGNPTTIKKNDDNVIVSYDDSSDLEHIDNTINIEPLDDDDNDEISVENDNIDDYISEDKLSNELGLIEYDPDINSYILRNHYFIQHIRIPLLRKPNFKNLMEIAYYVALFNQQKEDFNKLHSFFLEKYLQYRLDDVYTYIDIDKIKITTGELEKVSKFIDFMKQSSNILLPSDMSIPSTAITTKIVGGENFYYKKYIKYKNKYRLKKLNNIYQK